jgi:hypothetical protein
MSWTSPWTSNKMSITMHSVPTTPLVLISASILSHLAKTPGTPISLETQNLGVHLTPHPTLDMNWSCATFDSLELWPQFQGEWEILIAMHPLQACALYAHSLSISSALITMCTWHTCRWMATAHITAIWKFFSSSDSGPPLFAHHLPWRFIAYWMIWWL